MELFFLGWNADGLSSCFFYIGRFLKNIFWGFVIGEYWEIVGYISRIFFG
jgi:hypothetical protein